MDKFRNNSKAEVDKKRSESK